MQFRRFAIYYTPPKGGLATFGAHWLGWDIETGRAMPHPEISGLPRAVAELTATPRKYGLHGTIKPPFRLANGSTRQGLENAMETLASRLSPVTLDGLALNRIGSFLALTVQGDQTPLADLAGAVVKDLDAFRAPPTEAELTRRRQSRLSPRQEALLTQWGYPYVMDEFRFHITLTGRLARGEAEQVQTALTPHLAPLLPVPFTVTDLTLVGEDDAGMFHEIQRHTLSVESA